MSPGRSMTALDIGIQRVFYMIWWILYGRGRLGSKAGLLSRLLPETGAGFNQTKIRTYLNLILSQIRDKSIPGIVFHKWRFNSGLSQVNFVLKRSFHWKNGISADEIKQPR